jgi:hypothetical protein
MPEEINRLVTDSVSDYLFVTEESGRHTLLHESIPEDKIHFVGNVGCLLSRSAWLYRFYGPRRQRTISLNRLWRAAGRDDSAQRAMSNTAREYRATRHHHTWNEHVGWGVTREDRERGDAGFGKSPASFFAAAFMGWPSVAAYCVSPASAVCIEKTEL